jgi:hypothetical protein
MALASNELIEPTTKSSSHRRLVPMRTHMAAAATHGFVLAVDERLAIVEDLLAGHPADAADGRTGTHV